MSTTDINTKGRLLADSIREMAGAVNKEMDALAERVEATKKVMPAAFERAHNFIDHQQAEVTAIDDVLRTLSNLPLVGGNGSQTTQPALPVTQERRDTVELKPAPGTEALQSGIPANVAAALQSNK